MPPASCLALLGTCLPTCKAVLHEAPRAKLSLQLRPTQPVLPASMLQLLGGRTQPTTLSLLNSSTGPTAAAAAQPPLAPALASSNAKTILSNHALCCSCITRLDLESVLVDPTLLKAMQGLPALTHLHLSNIQLPASLGYKAANLPQSLRTLHVKLQAIEDVAAVVLSCLLEEFFKLDTITDLTITTINNDDRVANVENTRIMGALRLATDGGHQARALRKLCLSSAELRRYDYKRLKLWAPLLEELQVADLCWGGTQEGREEVSWLTLHVRSLDLGWCEGLPLGGTTPLDIHISGWLRALGDEDEALASVRHFTSQHTRPVRFVGAGEDGGAFTWDNSDHDPSMLVSGLSVLLQLSKVPVRSLDLTVRTVGDGEQLLLALQPLQALSQLSLKVEHWDDDANPPDQLLAQLPLHVQRVRLMAADEASLFSRMVVLVSKVPARQAHPLHLCVVGEGPGSGVWLAVDECRARGDVGVVMEEAWE